MNQYKLGNLNHMEPLSVISQQSQAMLTIYNSDNIQEWMEMYLYACKSRNLAKSTIQFYQSKLIEFNGYCLDLALENISQITPHTIRVYIDMLAEKGHNPGGVHAHYRSIKAFLNWYEEEAEPEGWRNPIKKVKGPTVPLQPLEPISMESLKALVNTCDLSDFFGRRDCAILLFMIESGARASELLALNIEDINLITGEVLIRQGKGRKPRTVYIGDIARKSLRNYLKKRKDFHPALWINKGGYRLGKAGLREILRRRSRTVNLPDTPSPHDFRRAFAIERWRAGADLVTLQKLMGHTTLTVLQRYLKQTGEDLELVARSSSPVDRHFRK